MASAADNNLSMFKTFVGTMKCAETKGRRSSAPTAAVACRLALLLSLRPTMPPSAGAARGSASPPRGRSAGGTGACAKHQQPACVLHVLMHGSALWHMQDKHM